MAYDYINKVDIELLMKNHLPEEFRVPIVERVLLNSMKAAFIDGIESGTLWVRRLINEFPPIPNDIFEIPIK